MMDPKTGSILAMATYPDYNLNTPFEPYTSKLAEAWETMPQEEKSASLAEVYKNRAVSDGYEPGSVFKILTATIGLEENIVEADSPGVFNCEGVMHIADRDIRCWKRTNPHGYQSLREALQNSCNPAFMQLGAKIGTRTLYKYYKAFGLFDKSGANFYGESAGIFHKENEVSSVDLAVMSFGQRIAITPLQLITAVSAIVNNGTMMQPRIVKQIVNPDTNVTQNVDPVVVRQVVSSETSATIRSMMKSVVTSGTGKYAAVEGYTIGGKTGTSEPTESNSKQGYVASYISIAPVENTQVVLLVTLYAPQGGSHEGGQIAAPVVSQILSEALPYLGIPSDNTKASSNDTTQNLVGIPDVKNKSFEEARSILEAAGFKVKSHRTSDDENSVVLSQNPKAGAALQSNAIVCIYDTDDANLKKMVTIPNLKGLSLEDATTKLRDAGLNISTEGSGVVISQSPSYNTQIEEGSIIKIIMKKLIKDVH